MNSIQLHSPGQARNNSTLQPKRNPAASHAGNTTDSDIFMKTTSLKFGQFSDPAPSNRIELGYNPVLFSDFGKTRLGALTVDEHNGIIEEAGIPGIGRYVTEYPVSVTPEMIQAARSWQMANDDNPPHTNENKGGPIALGVQTLMRASGRMAAAFGALGYRAKPILQSMDNIQFKNMVRVGDFMRASGTIVGLGQYKDRGDGNATLKVKMRYTVHVRPHGVREEKEALSGYSTLSVLVPHSPYLQQAVESLEPLQHEIEQTLNPPASS